MHVIQALRSDFYEIEISGKPADRWDLFLDWNVRERFGIVLYKPLAALGVIHLIQSACMCFYSSKTSRMNNRNLT